MRVSERLAYVGPMPRHPSSGPSGQSVVQPARVEGPGTGQPHHFLEAQRGRAFDETLKSRLELPGLWPSNGDFGTGFQGLRPWLVERLAPWAAGGAVAWHTHAACALSP